MYNFLCFHVLVCRPYELDPLCPPPMSSPYVLPPLSSPYVLPLCPPPLSFPRCPPLCEILNTPLQNTSDNDQFHIEITVCEMTNHRHTRCQKTFYGRFCHHATWWIIMELKDAGNSENTMLLCVYACGFVTRIYTLHYNPPGSVVV